MSGETEDGCNPEQQGGDRDTMHSICRLVGKYKKVQKWFQKPHSVLYSIHVEDCGSVFRVCLDSESPGAVMTIQ